VTGQQPPDEKIIATLDVSHMSLQPVKPGWRSLYCSRAAESLKARKVPFNRIDQGIGK
jgi:hypothetical protein